MFKRLKYLYKQSIMEQYFRIDPSSQAPLNSDIVRALVVICLSAVFLYYSYLQSTQTNFELIDLYLIGLQYKPERFGITNKRLRHRFIRKYCQFKNLITSSHVEEEGPYIEEEVSNEERSDYELFTPISHRFFRTFEFITSETVLNLCATIAFTQDDYIKNLATTRAQRLIHLYTQMFYSPYRTPIETYKETYEREEVTMRVSIQTRILKNLLYSKVEDFPQMVDVVKRVVFRTSHPPHLQGEARQKSFTELIDERNMKTTFWNSSLHVNHKDLKRFANYYISKEI